MDAIHKTEWFVIQELVPEHVYEERGDAAWELLDARAVITLDQLRNKFGPMIVNTWHRPDQQEFYGFRDQSGLRTQYHYSSIEDYLRSYSQHKYGRAFDILFARPSADQVRQYIFDYKREFPFICGVEFRTSWLHFDVRNCDRIKAFSQ